MDAKQNQEIQGMLLYQEELEQVEAELASVEVSLQELLDRQHVLTLKRSEIEAIIQRNESRHEQSKDLEFWNSSDFEWTNEIDSKMMSVFGLKELRPMQRQTMNATISGKDCLLIMPTGGGKSLCFQLPAVISKGLTLVVSPLVSLMEDQQMALEQLNVASAILTASSTKEHQKFVLDDMVKQNGILRLLYVTPEKLAKSKRFMNKLEKCYSINHLSRLVIDEVHCCSQWGHDFRPDYKFLGIMKRQFPKTPILGLTATATTKVLEDVKKILNIQKALELRASFNRPNLFYEVREKPNSQKESIEAILFLIKGKFKNQSGIVYCFSRKESEEVTTELSSGGVEAGCYHADMDPKYRSRVHRRWLEGTVQVVVATIAFGMGIDKPDVRFVIHHTISKSMENLYQESGRAGRDGKRSDCIVFYRLSDMIRQSTMVFTEQTGLSNLHGIVKYCTDASSCRRSVIARHFGEVWDSTQCVGMCDMCSRNSLGGNVEKRDISHHCADVLSLLDAASSTQQRVTAIKLVDAWYGKGSPGLRLKTVKAPSLTRATAERVLAHMLVHDYLTEDFHFTAYSTICYLIPGSKAKMIRNKIAKVFMDFPLPPSASKPKSLTSSSSSPSSSSSSLLSSSKARISHVPPASLSKKDSDSASAKSKLVVINMEKSHFNSMSTPSVTSSSSSTSSKQLSSKSSSSSSLKSSASSSSLKKSSSKKTSSSSLSSSLSSSTKSPLSSLSKLSSKKSSSSSKSSTKKPKTSDNNSDDDLNFDDDDDNVNDKDYAHNNHKSSQKTRDKTVSSDKTLKRVPVKNESTTAVSNGGDCGKDRNGSIFNEFVVHSDDGDDFGMRKSGEGCSDGRETEFITTTTTTTNTTATLSNKKKRKRGISSSSSCYSDNDEDEIMERSGHSLKCKPKTGSRLSLGKPKKEDLNNVSIVISDDEGNQ